MKEADLEELRQRVTARDDDEDIEVAFSQVDSKLRLLVELIDFAHEARVAELEQETAGLAHLPPRSVA